MTQDYYFGSAKWVGAADRTQKTFSILRGRFTASKGERVKLNILGLGFFKCYINGVCINPDTFLPLSSDYEAGADPVGEVISGHRVYVPSFDISDVVRNGENVIAIHYGGGWYTHSCRVFGLPKVIYRITVGEKEFGSDENCRIGKSFVSDYGFTTHECHDYTDYNCGIAADFDDSLWENAVVTEALDTEYCETDCPADALIDTVVPVKLGKGEQGTVYDCGENTTGYPVIKVLASKGEAVKVLFSEEATAEGALDTTHAHNQRFTVVSDGLRGNIQPEFTWFGFRYFEIIGNAEPVAVKVIHAAVPVTSTFTCDNEALNWAYKTFLHTMLTNMHTGHPSDCPHIERRGYTGDGQITCHAVLSALGAKEFYTKWLQDIGDCQDVLSGHVQYTAPYIRSGGGPGGWGIAMVEVPYQMYRHYGDSSVLEKHYAGMRRYIDYLEAHSEFGLVTSDKKGEWCLGDWCGPIILYPDKDISSANQQILIPAPLVNTYYMVKALDKMCEIARIIGKHEDIAEYKAKATERRNAIRAAYFNTFDGNFMLNAQGANAFAVDIGIGNSRTYDNLVRYYSKIGHYDTGILGTDVLTRVLFEHGDGELAVDILTGNGEQGFEHWRRNGATTLHEYWDSSRSRSHNHPMFGSPIAYFFEYLLGIRQPDGEAGYKKLIIEPCAVSKFGFMSGSMETANGAVAVDYRKNGGVVEFKISIPEKTEAVFRYSGKEYKLASGDNYFNI